MTDDLKHSHGSLHTMTDDPKHNQEILPPVSPAEEAVGVAKTAWAAAMARCAAAHRAVVANLDQSTDLTLRELLDASGRESGETPLYNRDLLLARMDQRVLLLAEALQKHGLLRILDAASAIDAVGRGITTDPVTDPDENGGSQ